MSEILRAAAMPLLAYLLQATIVTSLALLVAHLGRRRGPAFRIAIYRSAVLSTLLLTLAGPAIRLFVRPLVELGGQSAPPLSVTANRRSFGGDAMSYSRPTKPARVISSAYPPNLADRTDAAHAAPPAEPGASAKHPGPVSAAEILALLYLAGAGSIFAGILAGSIWLWRLRIGSKPYPSVPGAFTSRRIESAFAAGALAPRIYLPADIDARYAPAVVDAILRHEAVHVDQRDGLWALLTRIGCAFAWCSPPIWIVANKLRQDGEALCDRLVIESGLEPACYAGYLLEIAASFVSSNPARFVGAGVVTSRSQLSKRISLMLNSKMDSGIPLGKRSRRRVAFTFGLVLLAAAVTVSASPIVLARHEGTPQQTMQAWFDAYNKRDYRGVFTRIEGANLDRVVPAYEKTKSLWVNPLLVEQVPHISNVSVSGDTATLKLTIETRFHMGTLKHPKLTPTTDVATLHRVGGEWRLVDGKDPHGLLELTCENGRNPKDLERFETLSNRELLVIKFKNIGLAVLTYVGDHGDRFSLTQANLKSDLKPYLRTPAVWQDADGRPMDIQLNPWVVGKSISEISDLPGCVLLSMGPKGGLETLYGLTPIVFADGHAKLMRLEDAAKLSWN